jgi:phosphoribosylformimino-5-aminoimidazole carboxamide ribotide isomerase
MAGTFRFVSFRVIVAASLCDYNNGEVPMIIIPAIDLIDGHCVRLRQGSYAETTVYDEDPVAVAQQFVAAGAGRIHLVDLDAAAGRGTNRETITRIRRSVSCILELGGGIRSRDALAAAVDLGVDYAVVGTVLARDPDEVAAWATEYGTRMVASIDARDGIVQVAGWQETTNLRATDLAARAAEIGCAAVQYTDIARDGMLSGPNVTGTVAIAEATRIPVILSGGIASTEDADRVRIESRGRIAGVIVGRALYEGRFNLTEAIRRNGSPEMER